MYDYETERKITLEKINLQVTELKRLSTASNLVGRQAAISKEMEVATTILKKFIKDNLISELNSIWKNLRESNGSNTVLHYTHLYVERLEQIKSLLLRYPEEILLPTKVSLNFIPKQTKPNALSSGDSKDEIAVSKTERAKVFIVHGHDELNLWRIKDLLSSRWNIDPIILMLDRKDIGQVLIEKFETSARICLFAFALLTPDDIIEVEKGSNYAQARPNVIFELGWFYGALGRTKVCILCKKGTYIPSDLQGIIRKEFKESVEEKTLDIEDALRGAKII